MNVPPADITMPPVLYLFLVQGVEGIDIVYL